MLFEITKSTNNLYQVCLIICYIIFDPYTFARQKPVSPNENLTCDAVLLFRLRRIPFLAFTDKRGQLYDQSVIRIGIKCKTARSHR